MSSTLAAAALSTKGDDIEDLEVEDVIEEPLPSNDKREAGVHESVMPFDWKGWCAFTGLGIPPRVVKLNRSLPSAEALAAEAEAKRKAEEEALRLKAEQLSLQEKIEKAITQQQRPGSVMFRLLQAFLE